MANAPAPRLARAGKAPSRRARHHRLAAGGRRLRRRGLRRTNLPPHGRRWRRSQSRLRRGPRNTATEAAPAGHGAPAPSARADSGHGGGGGHAQVAAAGTVEEATAPGGHGTTNPNATVAFVNFGDIVVNLDERTAEPYLRLKIMLQVKPQDEGIVTTEMETQRTVLKAGS